MAFDEKRTAHAVSSSTGGKAEQSLSKAHSATSVTETGRDVKGEERLDARIWKLLCTLSDGQKEAALMRAEIMIAAHGPALPMLPPGPAERREAALPEGERVELIRLLKLHPEKVPVLRQVLSSDEGKAAVL